VNIDADDHAGIELLQLGCLGADIGGVRGISSARKISPLPAGSRVVTSAARSPGMVLSAGSAVVVQSVELP
jgi:hypothetical protein